MADAGAPTGTDLPWQHMTAAAGLALAALAQDTRTALLPYR